MEPSNNCVIMVAHFEQFVSNPYKDAVGIPTIGYGSTFYPNGKKVTMNDAPVSEEVARDWMKWELANKAKEIDNFLKAEINQAQYDALVSFAYNCGATALKHSTLMGLINTGELQKDGWKRTITAEFGKWVHGGNKILPGLVSRRATEAWLFCEGIIKYFSSKTIQS